MKHYGTIKNSLKTLLKTLKIFDADNSLSLTSVGVMIILFKIATATSLDWATASTLLLALLSYNFKKVLLQKSKQSELTDIGKLADLEAKLAEMNKAFNMKNLMR